MFDYKLTPLQLSLSLINLLCQKGRKRKKVTHIEWEKLTVPEKTEWLKVMVAKLIGRKPEQVVDTTLVGKDDGFGGALVVQTGKCVVLAKTTTFAELHHQLIRK